MIGDVKVAIYARVSTTDQNCEMQLRELREYCQRRKWTIGGEYVDTGWSGSKADRPQLNRLMKDARDHRFDCVLVWKIDRFSRSVLHLNQQLAELGAWKIRFVATSQNIDTDESNPTSRLIVHILAAVAEFERETIRERVKAGMKSAAAHGKKCGRPTAVFDRKRASELQGQGKSVRAIAAVLGTSRASVQRLLAAQKGA